MWVMPLTGVLAPDLILFHFVSLTLSCLPSPFYSSTAALLVVWWMLHRCFPHAIIRLFFKWLLGTDVRVCALSFPWLKSALHKEQIALLLSFWSNERKREKKPTQMMLVFVSGCLAMLHLGVCLLLLFSPITSAACRCFFLCLSSSAHFFPLWPNTLFPLLLNFLSSNTPVFVLPKSFSDPLPTPHLHLLLPLATARLLGWISHMCLGTKPVPFFVFSFWVQIHCLVSPSLPQWIHLTIVAFTFSFYLSCWVRNIFKSQRSCDVKRAYFSSAT